jgi:hypothetical protein
MFRGGENVLRPSELDLALRARAGFAGDHATVIDRRYIC